MKFTKAWTLALLLGASINFAPVFAQDEATETSAEGEAAPAEGEAAPAEGEATPAEGEAPAEGENAGAVEDAEEVEDFEPSGSKTEEWQYIFEQAAHSWDGFDIKPIPAPTSSNDGNRRLLQEENFVGQVKGQTGWSGRNQEGNKQMTWQLAIIVKANNVLSDIFKTNTADDEATQIGWWIPARNEQVPPENWTMNLVDVYLKPSVFQTELRMTQSVYTKGLYDLDGASIDGYNPITRFDEVSSIDLWKFDTQTGKLASWDEVSELSKVRSFDEYFVPIQNITKIQDDMLVFGLEGSNFKQKLPDLRVGNSVPFRFQIIDFDQGNDGRRLRQTVEVNIAMADDFHRCTKPFPCVATVVEEDFASSLYYTFAASSLAFLTMFAF